MRMKNATSVSALALVMIALAGCGQPDSPDPESTETGFPMYEGAELPDIAITEVSFDLPNEYFSFSRVVYSGDVLALVGNPESATGPELVAFDTADGSLLWQRDETEMDDLLSETGFGEGLFSFSMVVVGHDGSILVSYSVQGCPGDYDDCASEEHQQPSSEGIAALDPTDGSLLWNEPLTSRFEGLSVSNIGPVASSPEVLVINIHARSSDSDELSDFTVALDTQSGEMLWTAEGYRAVLLEGDVVVATILDEQTDKVLIVGFDALTGDERWELSDGEGGYSTPSVQGTSGFTVSTLGDSDELIDLDNGAILERSAEAYAGRIGLGAVSDQWLAAWTSRSDEGFVLYTRDLGVDEEVRGEHLLEDGAMVTGVSVDGYIWISSPRGGYAVDRTGAMRSNVIEGRPARFGEGSLLQYFEADDDPRLWSYEMQ